MKIRCYNHGVREEPLQHPKEILKNRAGYSFKETTVQLVDNINEHGIRTAGKHYLPLYGLVAFTGLTILAVLQGGSGGSLSPIGDFISMTLRMSMVVLWFGSPVMIYWDCEAAERYLLQEWSLGKLNALLGIFIGPAALILQVVYRMRKL
jgi:hypothetical protein